MNEEAKIQLSEREMELVNNTDWIFTKQLIIEKVYLLLGQLHEKYKKKILKEKRFLPSQLSKPGGKISKGENYKGLPYVILDYPASFSKEKILAVRTFFWWGNFFSIALHISGENFKAKVLSDEAIAFLKKRNFSLCINENEWQHDFDPFNFVSINEMDHTSLKKLGEKNFLKIAKKTELTEWNSAGNFLETVFEEIIDFIKVNFPAGEIDL
jgi:hypothetical protein